MCETGVLAPPRIAGAVLGPDYGGTGFRLRQAEKDRLACGVRWAGIGGSEKRKSRWCQEDSNGSSRADMCSKNSWIGFEMFGHYSPTLKYYAPSFKISGNYLPTPKLRCYELWFLAVGFDDLTRISSCFALLALIPLLLVLTVLTDLWTQSSTRITLFQTSEKYPTVKSQENPT